MGGAYKMTSQAALNQALLIEGKGRDLLSWYGCALGTLQGIPTEPELDCGPPGIKGTRL